MRVDSKIRLDGQFSSWLISCEQDVVTNEET